MSYGGTTCDRSCLDKQQSLRRGAKGVTKKGEGEETTRAPQDRNGEDENQNVVKRGMGWRCEGGGRCVREGRLLSASLPPSGIPLKRLQTGQCDPPPQLSLK